MLSKKIGIALSLLMVSGIELTAMEIASPRLIDSLLNDPGQTIKSIYATRNEFTEQAKQEGLDKEKNVTKLLASLGSLSQQYEQKCPIFFLGECTDANDWFPCVFTRSLNPFYRKRFEEKVSQSLIEKITSNQIPGPINYTSFGCGGALPEMVILTKVLAQKPDACLNIHLIEGNNICYVSAVDHLNILREITPNQQLFTFDDKTIDNYIQIVKEKDGITDHDDNDIKVQLAENCFEVHKKYKQMITWLTQTFPHAKLSLFVHEFTDSYLDYLDKHNLSHADVVAAADIQDEMSYLRGGPKNYVKLCAKTLEKNKLASNAWLSKNGCENVAICSLSLLASEGAEKMDIDNLSVYSVDQKL